MKDVRITYVTHACIKINYQDVSLLTDPWILNEPVYAFTTWKYPAAIMPPEQIIADLDYIFISHPHEDHLHIPSIDCFPRDIPILLPEYADYPGLRAQTVERTFRDLGFCNIIKIMPWQTIQLKNQVPFTLIPCAKTKYWDWENSGFVMQCGGTTILNMNDCPSDLELYQKVDELFGEIDLAFVQYSGVSMFPGCFRMPFEALKEASQNRKHSWVQQRNMLDHLKIKCIAPFAGDFAWLDDKLYHCNWSNRSTPKLFEDFVKENYAEKNIDVLIMYPSDTWDPKSGLTRNHPDIDWNNYLAEIAKVKTKFDSKVKAIRQWINDSSLTNLCERTHAYLGNTNRRITHQYIDFAVAVQVVIEGNEGDNLEFFMVANPEQGFQFSFTPQEKIDQSLYIDAHLWAAVLESKVLLTNIQWASQQKEHVPFRIEIARFWFWFENHVDLNNRNVQALVDNALYPSLTTRIRPTLGVFPIEGEWDKAWLA